MVSVFLFFYKYFICEFRNKKIYSCGDLLKAPLEPMRPGVCL